MATKPGSAPHKALKPFVATTRTRQSARSVFSRPDGSSQPTWMNHEADSQGEAKSQQDSPSSTGSSGGSKTRLANSGSGSKVSSPSSRLLRSTASSRASAAAGAALRSSAATANNNNNNNNPAGGAPPPSPPPPLPTAAKVRLGAGSNGSGGSLSLSPLVEEGARHRNKVARPQSSANRAGRAGNGGGTTGKGTSGNGTSGNGTSGSGGSRSSGLRSPLKLVERVANSSGTSSRSSGGRALPVPRGASSAWGDDKEGDDGVDPAESPLGGGPPAGSGVTSAWDHEASRSRIEIEEANNRDDFMGLLRNAMRTSMSDAAGKQHKRGRGCCCAGPSAEGPGGACVVS